MLASKNEKNIKLYESSNQIYISDLIGLQRTQRTQVVDFDFNKNCFPLGWIFIHLIFSVNQKRNLV